MSSYIPVVLLGRVFSQKEDPLTPQSHDTADLYLLRYKHLLVCMAGPLFDWGGGGGGGVSFAASVI